MAAGNREEEALQARTGFLRLPDPMRRRHCGIAQPLAAAFGERILLLLLSTLRDRGTEPGVTLQSDGVSTICSHGITAPGKCHWTAPRSSCIIHRQDDDQAGRD